jgi:hypothetical protein
LKINYYTLCWGKDYLNLLFKFSLKSFFSSKFKNKNNSHKLFIYTDEFSVINKKYKKDINYLRKKNIQIKLVNYKKKIDNFKKLKRLSVWRFLGKYQKNVLMHAKKNGAMCCFIYPDEIHSEKLSNKILEKIKYYDYVFTPSNEIFLKDFKISSIKKLTEKKLIRIKYKNIEKYNKKDFFNNKFYTSHQPRYYFKTQNVISYKSLHLSPIIMNPIKVKDIKNIYTIDTSLNYQGRKGYILSPKDGLLLSLEKNLESSLVHKYNKNLFLLFLNRIVLHIIFNYKNINGINPYSYLKTFTVTLNKKKCFSLKKMIVFDLFSLILFLISSLFKFIFLFKKYLKL